MELEIASLVGSFEKGHLTRRDLIRSLALLLGAGGLTPAQAAAAPACRGTGINHISYQVGDYARTRDFYVGLLGARVANDLPTRAQCELHLGDAYILPRTARPGRRPPVVDHVAIGVADWDKAHVEAELTRRRIRFRPDANLPKDSVHLTDPDGYDLQLINERVTASV